MTRGMKVSLLLIVFSIALVGCAASVTEAEVEWCLSEDGVIPWEFAAALDSADGWPQDLPRSPSARLMARDEATGEIPLTETRWISGDDYTFYVFGYEQLSWNQTYLEWAADNPERFDEICGLAVENSGDAIPSNPKKLQIDAQQLADYDAFVTDMRSVAAGTPLEVLEDVELVYAGERMCYSYSMAKLGMDTLGSDTTATLQNLSESRVEIVMTGIFSAYPPAGDEDYRQYVARALGTDWDAQMTEFGAALSYDSAHILCPEYGDFADDLARMS